MTHPGTLRRLLDLPGEPAVLDRRQPALRTRIKRRRRLSSTNLRHDATRRWVLETFRETAFPAMERGAKARVTWTSRPERGPGPPVAPGRTRQRYLQPLAFSTLSNSSTFPRSASLMKPPTVWAFTASSRT